MLLTPERLESLLVSVVERASGLPERRVILEGRAGPRPPEGLYCSIGWKTFEPLPQNHGDYTDEEGLPIESPGESPGEIPGKSAEASPGGLPEDSPEDSQANASDESPEESPGESPEDSPNDSPNDSPEDPPDGPHDDPSLADGRFIQHLRNETWCEMEITFWGPGAFLAACRLAGELQNDNRIFDLWRVIGHGGVGPITDGGEPSGGRFRQRCSLALCFYACFGGRYPVEWFDVSHWRFNIQGSRENFKYSKEIHEDPDGAGLSGVQ